LSDGSNGRRTDRDLRKILDDLLPSTLFVIGILVSVAAELRLRRADTGSFSNGCITAAGAGLVFVACAAAIR